METNVPGLEFPSGAIELIVSSAGAVPISRGEIPSFEREVKYLPRRPDSGLSVCKGDRLFSTVCCDRTRGDSFKLK